MRIRGLPDGQKGIVEGLRGGGRLGGNLDRVQRSNFGNRGWDFEHGKRLLGWLGGGRNEKTLRGVRCEGFFLWLMSHVQRLLRR